MSPKRQKLRLLLDENFPAPTGKFLQSLGHNVSYVAARRELQEKDDLHLLRVANKEKRIFVSMDKDFRIEERHRGTISGGEGVVVLATSDRSERHMKRVIAKLLREAGIAVMRGKVVRVSVDKLAYEDPALG